MSKVKDPDLNKEKSMSRYDRYDMLKKVPCLR
jgi:hypothetical protein